MGLKTKIYQAGGKRSWLLLAMILILSGCGFHLKGTGSAAAATYASVKIEVGGARSDIARALTQQYQAMGVKVVSSLADAELSLKLAPTGYTTSITGRSGAGDVSSELIKMIQPFSVTEVATEKNVLSSQAVAYRDRAIDRDEAQASNRELQSLQRQMANEIALQI
ncbi:MAG: hypothetical protein R3219_05775, partial [Hydrogenovibrio sp.]|nr:hypothetical protein [Hydrogenovibrio sp.]